MLFVNFDRSSQIVLHTVQYAGLIFPSEHFHWIRNTLTCLSAFYSPACTQEPCNCRLLFVKHTLHEVFCCSSEQPKKKKKKANWNQDLDISLGYTSYMPCDIAQIIHLL